MNWVSREVFNDLFCAGDPVSKQRWQSWCRDGPLSGAAQKFGREWRVDADKVKNYDHTHAKR